MEMLNLFKLSAQTTLAIKSIALNMSAFDKKHLYLANVEEKSFFLKVIMN